MRIHRLRDIKYFEERKKCYYRYLKLVNETLRTQVNAEIFCMGCSILMLNLWRNIITEERVREVKNETKISYEKIIMMFLILESSPNWLFFFHQTIDGQWDCAYLQLKLLQCWQLNVYAEQNNGAVPFYCQCQPFSPQGTRNMWESSELCVICM